MGEQGFSVLKEVERDKLMGVNVLGGIEVGLAITGGMLQPISGICSGRRQGNGRV